MPNYVRETANPVRVTTSGVQTLGAANAVDMLGVVVGNVLTSQTVQFWTQTANSVTGSALFATMVLVGNSFYPIPARFSKGLTYAVTTENVDITLLTVPAVA